jgi:acyl dehydratase
MPAFSDYVVGMRFAPRSRTVTGTLVELLTALGGYTHPLFTDATYVQAHSPFPASPLPGQAVLLLCGGLAEQSDAFDEHVVALVGLDEVAFRAAALPGDTLALEMEVVEVLRSRKGDRGVVTLAWRCRNQRDEAVLDARARMLVRDSG